MRGILKRPIKPPHLNSASTVCVSAERGNTLKNSFLPAAGRTMRNYLALLAARGGTYKKSRILPASLLTICLRAKQTVADALRYYILCCMVIVYIFRLASSERERERVAHFGLQLP